MNRPVPKSAPKHRSYRFGKFELYGSRGELRLRGDCVRVEPKALDVLAHLVEHRDRIVSIEELLSSVWDGVAVERGSVHRAVRLLRRALAADTRSGSAIATAPRRGYRFVLDAWDIGEAARPTSDPHYVGRRAICEELDQHLERALRGQTEWVLLHGPAGIGKSATLAWIARRAASAGARVIEGHCLEGPGAPPYQPWSRVLLAAIRADGADVVANGLARGVGDVSLAMPALAPALDARGGVRHSRERDRDRRDWIHAAVADWIRQCCRKEPLVLLLDDLDRADLDSLRLLRSVIHELEQERLLVVGTHREGPERGAIRDAIAELATLRPDASLRLAALARAELGVLTELRIGESLTHAEMERLADASGGNPLLAEQLLRLRREGCSAVRAPLAAGLRGVLRRLLEGASESCCELLSQACVFGREFDAVVVASALDWPRADVLIAVEEACARHLVEPDEHAAGLRFAHGSIPEALYAELPARERIDRHRRAVDAIEATRAHPQERLAALAHHAREAAAAIGFARAFDY